jgi:hypothetical protein
LAVADIEFVEAGFFSRRCPWMGLVMALACRQPLPLYRPRDPQTSDLWRLMDQHFDFFRQVYDERFQAKYGFWRPVVDRGVAALAACRLSQRIVILT